MVGKMTQWVEILVSEPKELSSVSGIYMVERDSSKLYLTSTYALWHTHQHLPLSHTHKYISK